jgi:hypothetical protein
MPGYLGADYPRVWPVPGIEADVHLGFDNTRRYALDTPLGAVDWATLLPYSNGTVFLGPHHRPFTPSLFQSLHCLGVMRAALEVAYARRADGRPPLDAYAHDIEWCAGYIRQTTLCAADLTAENVKAVQGRSVTDTDGTHVCRDWTAVYAAAEENWKEHQAVYNVA